jgi:hypothetical protein
MGKGTCCKLIGFQILSYLCSILSIIMNYKRLAFISGILLFSGITMFLACKKDSSNTTQTTTTTPATGPQLVFIFKFDSTQARLNNFGQPDTMPFGHSGQSPVFNGMSSHYIELAPTALTQLGNGDVLYRAPEVGSGSNLAIEFSKCTIVGQGAAFYSCPISSVTPGSYQWLRVSLAYQNYTIKWSAPTYSIYDAQGTIASFVGFNTYITSYKIKDSNVVVNGNKAQGYWGFEDPYNVVTGQAPATTVPNPIASTSPIPAGSCVVTGQFSPSFTITGNETKNDTIIVSLSTNKSFEWKDANMNGVYEPLNGDTVVNMGIRGLIPTVK